MKPGLITNHRGDFQGTVQPLAYAERAMSQRPSILACGFFQTANIREGTSC